MRYTLPNRCWSDCLLFGGWCFSQVMSLSPAPLSLLIKAAPILTDDMYGDIQPAAWELLLSVDEHMAAAAGESACGRRIPYFVCCRALQTELMSKVLNC